jgi:hypothetical protein
MSTTANKFQDHLFLLLDMAGGQLFDVAFLSYGYGLLLHQYCGCRMTAIDQRITNSGCGQRDDI